MQWQDKGIILSQRPYKESYSLVSVFTYHQGRYSGIIRLGRQPSMRAQLQPGNFVQAQWQARLSEHLGSWKFESEQMPWTHLLSSPHRLAALSSACTLLDKALPERHPYSDLYDNFVELLSILLSDQDWQRAYLRFELNLLSCLGFGLTLEFCAVTRSSKNLSHVSPKTGHAVCEAAAKPYADRLLKLPAFLLDEKAPYTKVDLQAAYHLTGYFLRRYIFENKELPPLRQKLAA